MILAGKLLTMKEASMLLFGDDAPAIYKRTMRLVRSNCETVNMGRSVFVSKSVLEEAFQIGEQDKKEAGDIATRLDSETQNIVITLPKR